MADEIKDGDVVELKSGSVQMSVTEVDATDAWVIFEDAKGVHHAKCYSKVALKKVS